MARVVTFARHGVSALGLLRLSATGQLTSLGVQPLAVPVTTLVTDEAGALWAGTDTATGAGEAAGAAGTAGHAGAAGAAGADGLGATRLWRGLWHENGVDGSARWEAQPVPAPLAAAMATLPGIRVVRENVMNICFSSCPEGMFSRNR